jgi:DNA invertase Pin-like site-specific DNA recombinase
MAAVAYLRRSRVDARRTGAISYEQQMTAVRRLAEQHGDDPDALVVIEDWGKSGRAEKQHLRGGFARLEEMVRDGTATAVYAYSANRLARSLEALAKLAKACEAEKVPIRCADGYSPDVSTSTGRMVLGILGSVYAWQAEWTQERAVEATAIRRANGAHLGPAPYGFRVVGGRLVENDDEDPSVVLNAYRDAGRTYSGAARLLNEHGVPVRGGKGGTFWRVSTVRDMLRRTAPGETRSSVHRGRPAAEPFLLAGLLRCPFDGKAMTGSHDRRRNGWVAYECRDRVAPGHPYPRSIAESKVLPWIEAEAARLAAPGSIAIPEDGYDDSIERLALEGLRGKVADAVIDAGLADLDAQRAARGDQIRRVVEVPLAIEWEWPTDRINAILRAMWDRVELGPDLRPVRAEWTVPEWRS